MFRTIVPLLFLFSVTAIPLRPNSNDVNFNTWSVLEGEKHSNKGNVNAKGHLKVDYVFMSCDGRENTVIRSRRKKMLQTVPIRGQTDTLHFQWCLGFPYFVFPHLMAFFLLRVGGRVVRDECQSVSDADSSVYACGEHVSQSSDNQSFDTILMLLTKDKGHHSFWKRKVIIGIATAVPTALLICMIICCFRYNSLRRQVKLCLTPKSDLDIEAFLKIDGALAQKRYKFSEVKKMTNSFKVKLGQGGFGAVYKGNLPTGGQVAVKLLNASKGNGEDFMNEVASISRTSHVNVVTLVGFCLEGRKKALIYEFMENGSLDKFIYKKGPETIASLSWEILYQIAIGIARGLEYLHRGCNTRILHFDIKPHNILLDENFCPKISDFGLAKLCPRKESIISMSDARGTMGYVAPEMCNRHFGGVSHKSDVYSYGMMLLEMVGGRKNINPEASHTSAIYFPHLVFKRLEQDSDLRPDEVMTPQENEIVKRLTIVGLWCIQTFPDDRPTMGKVIDMLEGSINSLEMPPKPMLSSPTRSVTESIEE
ncbi:hypothetical protein VNO77_33103 [Canavalia gladiata]|uniref:Protein kinase domain-containing protein n=1 Tax=Canavalia gladiata TaxID=3824 RepID=A0AAN9KBS2_CANGL